MSTKEQKKENCSQRENKSKREIWPIKETCLNKNKGNKKKKKKSSKFFKNIKKPQNEQEILE